MKEFLHHLFVPRHSNNHRSRLLHHKIILFFIVTLLIGQFFISFTKTHYENVLGALTDVSSQELLDLTNMKRQETGTGSLQLNDQLSLAAQLKAKDMFEKNYWAHNAPDGTQPWSFIKTSGYTYIYAGENLARGFTTTEDVVDAWMNSPSHRDNMLSGNYNEVGFAIVKGNLLGEETILVVQMLGKSSQAIAQNQPAQVVEVPVEEAPVSIATQPALEAQITPVPTITQSITRQDQPLVAAIRTSPIINSNSLTWNIAFAIIAVFIGTLLLDLIVIKRKKIVRLVGHNFDHIFFLCAILIFIIFYINGSVL